MTTEEIRKHIYIQAYGIYLDGIKITYVWFDKHIINGQRRDLILPPAEAAKELASIGEIETWYHAPLMLKLNNKYLNWDEFYTIYTLSQWDALNLVIRHELTNEIEKEDGMLNITKAIDKLKTLK